MQPDTNTSNTTPLVVDLDGTLISSDILIESFLALLKKNPLYLFLVLVWLYRSGKAGMKRQIANRTDIDVANLPYNHELINYLTSEKTKGRTLALATASDAKYAQAIADYLGIFDRVFSSDSDINLSGHNKQKALSEAYGSRNYVYAGNEPVDFNVWQDASAAIVIGHTAFMHTVQQQCPIEKHIPNKTETFKTWIKALRVHQWVKNTLIFIPFLTAHQQLSIETISACLLAFIAFSLCASSVYLLNDLLDLAEDRQHVTKCNRPFAAGSLSLLKGIFAVPTLLIIAGCICLFLPVNFAIVLACYYIITVAYSFYLKRVVLIDVIVLSNLYTVRIVAGAMALSIALSFWLLTFSVFIFLSLAIMKRYTELLLIKSTAGTQALGRGYQVEDIELLSSLGGSSGYVSVLVLALYINSDDVKQLYVHPEIMWPICIVMLYWVSRVWVLTHRGKMREDPIIFALKDKASIVCGIIIGLFILLAA